MTSDRERRCTTGWFRVEVSDQAGQVVAIESEMLAGRDIGEAEQAVIVKAIEHLSGFIGLASLSRPAREDEPGLEKFLGLTRDELEADDIEFLRQPGILETLRRSHTAGIVRALAAMVIAETP